MILRDWQIILPSIILPLALNRCARACRPRTVHLRLETWDLTLDTLPQMSTGPISLPRPRRLRWRRWLAALFLLLVAAFVVWWNVPRFTNGWLCLDDGSVRADALVVMGGGVPDRPRRAAELFRNGAAPKIIVTGDGDWADNRNLLLAAGVPSDAIQLEPDAKNTRQNARRTLPLLRSLGARRVIIVTTWYHSRRSLKTFRHYAPDLQFYSCPSYYGYAVADRPHTNLPRQIRLEYVKLVGYAICYGVWPF